MGWCCSKLRKWFGRSPSTNNNGNGKSRRTSNSSQNKRDHHLSPDPDFRIVKTANATSHNVSSLPNEDVYIALYDYGARTVDDLSFKKGDLMVIMDFSQGDWWMARLLGSYPYEGYVPSNYIACLTSLDSRSWFFGKTKRVDADRLLLMPHNGNGSFLIRDRENNLGEFALTIRHYDRTKHYRIHKAESGGYFIARRLVFQTLYALVEHYSHNADGLCMTLGAPCKRIEIPQTVGLSHALVDDWEIDRSSIALVKKLGEGQFGAVYEGLWNGTTRVAVKTLKTDTMNREDFLREAQVMKTLRHPKLVQLFAVCSQEDPIYIITELMVNGALNRYLQDQDYVDIHSLIYMAAQVANGMAYLESNRYVHRDLAARNILVGTNNICKVADFGLARLLTQDEIYATKESAKFPIKWTAPEAARTQVFTTKSDVWSFGVLLTEIIGKGRMPYPGMTNKEVLQQIPLGYRMNKFPECPDALYEIMLHCWQLDPCQRPSFDSLHHQLEEFFYTDQIQPVSEVMN